MASQAWPIDFSAWTNQVWLKTDEQKLCPLLVTLFSWDYFDSNDLLILNLPNLFVLKMTVWFYSWSVLPVSTFFMLAENIEFNYVAHCIWQDWVVTWISVKLEYVSWTWLTWLLIISCFCSRPPGWQITSLQALCFITYLFSSLQYSIVQPFNNITVSVSIIIIIITIIITQN